MQVITYISFLAAVFVALSAAHAAGTHLSAFLQTLPF